MRFRVFAEATVNFIKKRTIFIILCLSSLIVYSALGLVSSCVINSLPEQNLAQRWSDDMNMAQVSIFITEDQLVKEDELKKFTYLLEKKLVEAGITGDEEDVENEAATSSQIVTQ